MYYDIKGKERVPINNLFKKRVRLDKIKINAVGLFTIGVTVHADNKPVGTKFITNYNSENISNWYYFKENHDISINFTSNQNNFELEIKCTYHSGKKLDDSTEVEYGLVVFDKVDFEKENQDIQTETFCRPFNNSLDSSNRVKCGCINRFSFDDYKRDKPLYMNIPDYCWYKPCMDIENKKLFRDENECHVINDTYQGTNSNDNDNVKIVYILGFTIVCFIILIIKK